jgi:hypothetical protein
MGEIIEAVLKKCSHDTRSTQIIFQISETITANCLYLGFWTGSLLHTASRISGGELKSIMKSLSLPAEQAIPYINELGCNTTLIAHGYDNIMQDLERRFSSKEASAYRIGYRLAGALSPQSTIQFPYDIPNAIADIKSMGVSGVETLERSIQRGNRQQIFETITGVLLSLGSAFERRP